MGHDYEKPIKKTKYKKKKKKPNASEFYIIQGTGDENSSIRQILEQEIQKTDPKFKFNVVPGSLNQDIRKFYKFQYILGGGHFGSVRIAYKKNNPKKFYAVKSIQKKNVSEEDMDDLIREVEIISGLQHPNIVKFYETYHDFQYFHIVMELCTGKEVFEKIIQDGKLTEQTVARIITKVLHAISYCHSQGITHRDLKPENILLKSIDDDAEVKIIDFGLSRKYLSNEKMHTILGTAYYIAPEVLKGEYDEKCDVWSIGAMTYIMLSGEPAFNGSSNNEIFNKIINEELKFPSAKWKQISEDAKDFIKCCLIKNPDQRTSAQDALNHPWFKNILENVHNEVYLNSDILNNLKNFSSPEKFKKIVLRFIANNVSDKELLSLKKAFYAMDLNHSGHITVKELEQAFKNVGTDISKEELDNIVESAGGKFKGKIDYSEFLIACMNQKKNIKKEKLIEAFEYFDVDDSGFIDAQDIQKAMLRVGKKVVDEQSIEKVIISEVHHKGKISLEDFLNIFGVKEDE